MNPALVDDQDRIRERSRAGQDVFVYFNNDGDVNALRNARTSRHWQELAMLCRSLTAGVRRHVKANSFGTWDRHYPERDGCYGLCRRVPGNACSRSMG